ncbi:hypothetical protein [Fodinicola feengrottensis]|uniref:hypothetical protein n=1 Tax=Fodinicola feengrottensis TaxID=435914 RepID=UPI0031D07874
MRCRPAGCHRVRPSSSILRQLESLPAGWAAFSAAAPAALNTATLKTDLTSALSVAAAFRALGVTPTPATLTSGRALAHAISGSIRGAATLAAQNAVRAFLSAEITPVLQTSVTALTTAVGQEVDTVMATPAGSVATTAPKDPAIAALATSMHTQLTTQAAAATAAQGAAAGSTAVNPGTTAPPQAVTYGTANMMSDNSLTFRADQFSDLANKFNSAPGLRHDREDPFKAETV